MQDRKANPAVGEYELVDVNSITNTRKKVPISQAPRKINFEHQTVTPGVGSYSFKSKFEENVEGIARKPKQPFQSPFGTGTIRFQGPNP